MKVFISWSGENKASHKIALALREWLPNVIQRIEPFVSSEDIEKGERGLKTIEERLKDCKFGILCVTKENYRAPWLLYEAGALSNNPNRVPVAPFLIGLKPSDLSGSPLNQFQETYSGKDDIKKLVTKLNKTCETDGITEDQLTSACHMWFPELEKKFDAITEISIATEEMVEEVDSSTKILEEILDISRNNQKSLVTNNQKSLDAIIDIGRRIEYLFKSNRMTNQLHKIISINSRMFKDMFYLIDRVDERSGINIMLSLFKDFAPWICDIGKDTMDILSSKKSIAEKNKYFRQFIEILDFTHEWLRYVEVQEEVDIIFEELKRKYYMLIENCTKNMH